jgi:periplasmic glucans biosynthesis protein
LVERARTLAAAAQPTAVPAALPELPAELRDLTYDQYRSIRFKPDRSLWRSEGGFFEVQLFHLGFYYREPVAVFQLEPSSVEARRVAFTPDLFSYQQVAPPKADAALGFAGLRLHAPINTPQYRDEVIAFQGASYFRSLGQNEVYGLSARGLAIDTGEPGPEEFPRFSELYLVRPQPQERAVWVLALLESRRATGAYAFRIEPGRSTIIEVTAQILLREPVGVLGIAPLTSMFLFGEDAPARFGDFRPEVHDSDSLALWNGSGEKLVRPLRNPQRTTVCSFRLDSPRGFGLLQRDKAFASYQDLEARYQDRPSIWVEPLDDWGPGAVRLLEIATEREIDDNIAALWVPDRVPADGLRVRYRLHVGGDNPFERSAGSGSGGEQPPRSEAARVVATRNAKIDGVANGQRFVVDFVGARLEPAKDVRVRADASHARIVQQRVEQNPFIGGLRAVIDVVPEAGAGDVELRAFLQRGDEALSETWSFLWQSQH